MRDIILKSRKGSRALSTPESMLSGLVAGAYPSSSAHPFFRRSYTSQLGSATSIFTNPIWVVQNIQIKPQDDLAPDEKHLNVLQTIRLLFKKGGFGAFFRGLTPALILVINPIIQYTVFEQLKNFLIKRRTAKLRAAGGLATAVAALSDWDYFFLGALSKLGELPRFWIIHAGSKLIFMQSRQVSRTRTCEYLRLTVSITVN